MSQPRFTIAQSMAVVMYVGFGFFALRNADALWASATFTLAVIMVSVAFVGALARAGNSRIAWAGFATAGGASLAIWLATTPTVSFVNRPPLLFVTCGLYKLQPYINPTAFGGKVFIVYAQISHSLEVILLGAVRATLGRLVVVKDDRPNP
jgi:hypothetical protein